MNSWYLSQVKEKKILKAMFKDALVSQFPTVDVRLSQDLRFRLKVFLFDSTRYLPGLIFGAKMLSKIGKDF